MLSGSSVTFPFSFRFTGGGTDGSVPLLRSTLILWSTFPDSTPLSRTPYPPTPEESFPALPAAPPVEPLELPWPAELPCPDALPPYWAWAAPATLKIITLETAKTAAFNRGIDVGVFMMSFPSIRFLSGQSELLNGKVTHAPMIFRCGITHQRDASEKGGDSLAGVKMARITRNVWRRTNHGGEKAHNGRSCA
jgi:hypothetical protein